MIFSLPLNISHVILITLAPAVILLAYEIIETNNLINSGVFVKGTVIELDKSYNSEDNSVTYAPIIVFKTIDNKEIKFKSSFYSNPPNYKKDEIVDIVYNPLNSQEAKIYGPFIIWWPLIFSSIVVSIFLAVLFFSYKSNKAVKRD